MKIFFTGSIVLTKLLTLLCFTHMGLMKMDMTIHAQAPCHQTVTTTDSTKDCNACVTALDAWSASYIEADLLEIPDPAFVYDNSFDFTVVPITLTARLHQTYRPPPQVTWVNAFHLPQKSTVLIV